MRLTLEYGGQVYSNWTEADLIAAGVPQADIDAAKVEVRVDVIKAECRRRIYHVASAESQLNMAAAAAAIAAKDGGSRSAVELAMIAGYASAIEWVKDMRDAVQPLAVDLNSTFRDDASWPALPQDAAAVIAAF